MKVSNISSVRTFFTTTSTITTESLSMVVSSIGDDFIVVAPSDDADVLVKLRGVTGIAVGSTITVNVVTGEVSVVEDATIVTPKKKAAIGRGCGDKSFITR